MLARLILIALVVHSTLRGLHAQEDGVYEWENRDGAAVKLKIVHGEIEALTNSNDLFNVHVCFDPNGRPSGTLYYLILNGVEKKISGYGRNGDNPTFMLQNLTRKEADSASAILELPLPLREHPGHRIDAVFSTDEPIYTPGEPILVTLTLKNLTDQPLIFTKGLSGPLNPQFTFAVTGPRGSLAVNQSGGGSFVMVRETIPPHGEAKLPAKLSAWFDSNTPGRYYILGSYTLAIFKSPTDESPVWFDYITRPFTFDVNATK
jgi:hypothetical protein